VAYEWVDCDHAAIIERYDRIAGLIIFFEWLLFLPRGLRREAVERLSLRPGEKVLEVGCGTGRNFPYLSEAVGKTGRVYGVDLSPGMLRNGRALCARSGLANIELTQGDAADFMAPVPLDAVFFSFSYNTMPHHLTVLRRAWNALRPGGRLVIVDAKLPPGLAGRLILPFSLWLMKRTLLGNPYIRPWEDLRQLGVNFARDEFLFGSYYICRAVKP